MSSNEHPIIPNHYFAYPSTECHALFRGGHYFGCIALCQSLAEAYARFIYERWTKQTASNDFNKNIRNVRKSSVMPDISNLLEQMYGDNRNDFHHLNPNIPQKREQLEAIAIEKISLLDRCESQLFEYDTNDKAALIPKYPMYWETTEAENIYLRLDDLESA